VKLPPISSATLRVVLPTRPVITERRSAASPRLATRNSAICP
jgi:hypothetical protein